MFMGDHPTDLKILMLLWKKSERIGQNLKLFYNYIADDLYSSRMTFTFPPHFLKDFFKCNLLSFQNNFEFIERIFLRKPKGNLKHFSRSDAIIYENQQG